MTIYFIDPENGDNSKDGKSFANRWKSFGPSLASPGTEGDEYRIIASPDPYLLGTASWVDDLGYITLQTPVIKMVDSGQTDWVSDKSAWELTPLPDPTPAGYLNTSVMLNRAQSFMNWNSGGGTGGAGVIAHRDLGATLDLSAYTHLSMVMFDDNSNFPLEGVQLRLCSDTLGQVAVASFPLSSTRSIKRALLVGSGSALPNNVRSVSLSVTGDPGYTAMIGIQQIVACKAPGHPQHLSHQSLISRRTEGEPEWLPIRAFTDDGKVYIGGLRHADGADVVWRTWRGPSGNANVWAMSPLIWEPTHAYDSKLYTDAESVKVTGGWDRTAMAERTGTSVLHGRNATLQYSGDFGSTQEPWNRYLDQPSQKAFFLSKTANTIYDRKEAEISGISFCEWENFPVHLDMSYRLSLDIEDLVSVSRGLDLYGAFSRLVFSRVSYCRQGPLSPVPSDGYGKSVALRGELVVLIDKIYNTGTQNYFPPSGLGEDTIIEVKKIYSCSIGVSGSFQAQGSVTNYADTMTFDLRPGFVRIRNCEFSNNGYDVLSAKDVWLDGATFLSHSGEPYWGVYEDNTRPVQEVTLRIDRCNGNPWDSRVYTKTWDGQVSKIVDDVSRVPGYRSMYTYAHDFQYRDYKKHPYFEQVVLVPARGGELTTVSAQVMFKYGGAEGCIGIATREGISPGVGNLEGMTVRRYNEWCRVVLSFTTTEDCLVPIFIKNLGCEGYVSEAGLDNSGVGPDGPTPEPEPEATDTFSFIPVTDTLGGVYDAFSAGSALAGQVMNSIGFTVEHIAEGTVTASEGDIIGVVNIIVTEGGGGVSYQTAVVLKPGWLDQSYTSLRIALYDAAGNELSNNEAYQVELTDPAYDTYGLLTCYSALLTAGQPYTAKLLRLV